MQQPTTIARQPICAQHPLAGSTTKENRNLASEPRIKFTRDAHPTTTQQTTTTTKQKRCQSFESWAVVSPRGLPPIPGIEGVPLPTTLVELQAPTPPTRAPVATPIQVCGLAITLEDQ